MSSAELFFTRDTPAEHETKRFKSHARCLPLDLPEGRKFSANWICFILAIFFLSPITLAKMMLQQIKPKNARSKRALKKREPQIVENPKTALFLRSTTSSSLNHTVMADLLALKRPLAIRFTKKNAIHPFEDAASLEFFSQKNDASLIVFASHSKKRPHAITFIRTFGGKVLDMLECLVLEDTARALAQFGGAKARVGTKPMLSFSGTQFEDESEGAAKFRLAKSVFLDFFRGEEPDQIDVEGLQMMITFTASEEEVSGGDNRQVVHMRVWRVITKRSGQKLPRVELEEMGPRIDFRLGRMQNADPDMMKQALRRSKKGEERTKKNIQTDTMGDKLGRIHLGKQDLSELQTRKMKGLKRGRDDEDEEDGDMDDGEDLIIGDDDDEDDDESGSDDEVEFIDEDAPSEGEDDVEMQGVPVNGTSPKAKKPRLG